jgi:hypothetical protein
MHGDRVDGDRAKAHAVNVGDRRIEGIVEREIGAHGSPAAGTRICGSCERSRDPGMRL